MRSIEKKRKQNREREEAGAGCHLHFPAVAGRCFVLLRGPGRMFLLTGCRGGFLNDIRT